MSEPVLVETVDGVATVTLNRPESFNSLNLLAKLLLLDALRSLDLRWPEADFDVAAEKARLAAS